jgi:hypothetical protein
VTDLAMQAAEIAAARAAKPTVVELLSRVMEDVQAVRKGDRNQQQGFNFRGIDAVVNAVGPALRKHGVVAVPVAVSSHFESYQSRQGAQMRNTVLTVTWRFHGPAGDHVDAQTMGEASDAGDKSVTKAHSVAYRTLLLQALCDWKAEAEAAKSADHVRELWRECKAWGELSDELAEHFTAVAHALDTALEAALGETPAVVDAVIVTEGQEVLL